MLGILCVLSIVQCEACTENRTGEKTRHVHRSRCILRHARTADNDPTPYFDNDTSRNVTTMSGKTAYLPCRVRHLGDRTVSWIRRRDLHVLTVGRFTYTSDQRFQTIHLENSDDWTLQIKYPQKHDAGIYECQVSTVPKMSIFITLNVVVSRAKITGGPTLYINSGSTLNLTCIVMESPVLPDYVFWYHNGKVINYDSPNIKLKTEMNLPTTSKLLISNAQPKDSGNYSCVPSNSDPADIAVHVLNGENPAAMQHGKHASSASSRPTRWNMISLMFSLVLYVCEKR